MTPETIEIIKIVSGVMSLFGYALYIFTIPFGKTRPSRSSWWILSVVWMVTLLSSVALADGTTFGEKWVATPGSWLTLAYIIGSLITAILSVWWYSREKWESFDYLCAAFAGIAVLLYGGIQIYMKMTGIDVGNVAEGLLFGSLITSLVADFFGILPTIKNAWEYPHKESGTAWGLELVASILSLVVVTTWILSMKGVAEFAVPLYLTVMNGIILLFILRKFYVREKKESS